MLIKLWKSNFLPAKRNLNNIEDTNKSEKLIKIKNEHLFPSGRSAMKQALSMLGISRNSLVAIPPYSSECVISSVAAIGTPITFPTQNVSLSAIIIYEQWGWTLPSLALSRIKESYPDVPIILDSVDTPYPGADIEDPAPVARHQIADYRLWSFGKVLGSIGGGLLTQGERLCKYSKLKDLPQNISFENGNNDYEKGFFRTYSTNAPDELIDIVSSNSFSEVMIYEIECRKKNVNHIRTTVATDGWRPWMYNALDLGAAPGIAPLFLGSSKEYLQDKSDELRNKYNIESSIYHFNASGDPLNPEYLLCLAVPLHSEVKYEDLVEAIPSKSRTGQCKTAIVIGGGTAGILSGTLLSDKYERVVIVESSQNLGGLMRSESINDNLMVDFGTHVPMTTGHNDIDRIIFNKAIASEWNVIKRSLKEGIYQNGNIDIDSGCLDANYLSEHLKRNVIQEVLDSACNMQSEFKNLTERLISNYGKTLTSFLFKPVIKKLTDRDTDDLSSSVLDLFHITRIRLFNSNTTKLLKSIPEFDSKIAFKSTSDGKSNIIKLYPKSGGAGKWIDCLIDLAKEKGVQFKTGVSVNNITVNDRYVSKLELTDGEVIDSDLLIWSAPPVIYLKMIGEKFPSSPPVFYKMLFVHLVFDKPFKKNLEYLCCYEQGFLTYRVTFYQMLKGEKLDDSPFVATVEVIITDKNSIDLNDESQITFRICEELKTIGVVGNEARVIEYKISQIDNALPLHTPESESAFSKQVEISKSSAHNVLMIGRNNHKNGLTEVMLDVYKQINEYPHSIN